jgi:hypothetical protein
MQKEPFRFRAYQEHRTGQQTTLEEFDQQYLSASEPIAFSAAHSSTSSALL